MRKYNNILFDESELKMIPCEYEKHEKYENGIKIDEFIFKTDSGIKYSVYFKLTEEDDESLPNRKHLSYYTDLKKIPMIFFSPTEKSFDSEDSFNEITNKEQLKEIMNKIIYIIRKHMDENKYDVYSYDTDSDKKNEFFKYYWIYLSDFLRVEVPSKNYSDSGKKVVNYLIRDYGRFIYECKYVKTSETGRLKLPWSKD